MKKSFLLLFSLLLILVLVGCGGPSSQKNNIYYTAVKNVAPVFEPAKTSNTAKAAWGNPAGLGHPIYEIFCMFCDYDPATDNGTGIGLANIYKLMYQAGQFYNDCQQKGTSISDTTMTSPFDFGRTDNVYNKVLIDETSDRANYFAMKKDGNIDYCLLCWYINRGTSGIEHGILQGNYNESSGDIDIDLVCFVDYSTSKYSHRTHLEGNSITHHFTKLLVGKWNEYPGNTGYRSWYVGTGCSRGAGEKFLFKVADNGSLTEPGKYFEFPADADEATLQTLNDSGSDTTTLTDYQGIVDSLVTAGAYYEVITNTPTEVPTAESSFTGSGMGNMKPGGM